MGDIPGDCTECGVCCTSVGVRHAPVSGDDWSRLGDDAERVTHWIANRAFMRIELGRCVALERRGARLACAIYERRPEVCRALERGSPACEAEIARKGPVLPMWRG